MTEPALRHAGINLGGTQDHPDADAESGIFCVWMARMRARPSAVGTPT